MSVVHIYSLPQVLWLTTGIGAPNMNYPVNRTDFRLYRGVSNTIEVYIKDIDRKPVALDTGASPIIHIMTRDRAKVLLSRPMTSISATKAHWKFTILPEEIIEWDNGALEYVVTVSAYDGAESMLYTDQGYGPKGTLYVFDGPIAQARDPIVVAGDALIRRDATFYSGPLEGSVQAGNLGLHMITVYGNDFSGSVTVQATLDTSPTNDDSQWADVETFEFTSLNGIAAKSVEGNFFWVRFAVTPTSGSLIKLMLRN